MYIVLFILLTLKTLIFMYNTEVVSHQIPVFLVSFLIILFVLSSIHLSNLKKKHWFAFSFYALVSFIMFVDVVYYGYFNALPSVSMLSQVDQITAVGDSIRELLNIKRILFILDLPLICFYILKSRKEYKEHNIYLRVSLPSCILLVLVVMVSILNKKDLLVPVANQEFFTYHIMDIKYYTIGDDVENLDGLSEKDLEELKERTKLKEGKYTGVGKGKNLIVIQVEALQNFVINHYYDGQEITPNLNRLLKEKGIIYFNNYYQLLGRGNTSDAEFVSNNSLYPSMDEPTYIQFEENTFYGLPWILRDRGYTAWVFHGYEKEFWNRNRAYVNQGFQRFISEEDYEFTEEETIGFGIIDEVFYEQTLEYIKELDNDNNNPFYAFIISLTSHTPFEMPEGYQYLNIRKEHEGTILGNYLQAILYADRALGDFLQGLKEEGYYDNSVIAIYGDHFAISSLDKDKKEIMTHYLGYEYDLDEMMKVPLIIHIPGLDISETIVRIGIQLDFLPTILNIMGYENEKGLMFGRDL
ncbi:MAG: LTA synthase family protein, partial [Tissierellia bacterium]|nr:LTA synthase family protein [Tissierellia bacterium]